jgi:cinnamyl-alcohol dehydrogenase
LVGSRCTAGSATGGTNETEEMIDFCAKNKIYPVEIIKIDYINQALDRLTKSDVKYRFVIDIENSFN